RHLVRLFAAGAQDGAAQGEDAGDIVRMEDAGLVLDEAAEALLDADDLDVEIAEGGLGDAADGGIEAGAVPAAGENADATGFAGHGCLFSTWMLNGAGGRDDLCDAGIIAA